MHLGQVSVWTADCHHGPKWGREVFPHEYSCGIQVSHHHHRMLCLLFSQQIKFPITSIFSCCDPAGKSKHHALSYSSVACYPFIYTWCQTHSICLRYLSFEVPEFLCLIPCLLCKPLLKFSCTFIFFISDIYCLPISNESIDHLEVEWFDSVSIWEPCYNCFSVRLPRNRMHMSNECSESSVLVFKN